MWTCIIIGLLVLVVIGFFQAAKKTSKSKHEKEKELSDKYNLDESNELFSAKYLGGHPSINNNGDLRVFHKNNQLVLVSFFTELVSDDKVGQYDKYDFYICGSIDFASIKEVTLEDQSTIENRITVGRMLLVGPLAFAWKKKEKIESAYLILDWNDGTFNHKTLFEFTGSSSMQKANTARNKLINTVKKSEIIRDTQ